MDEDRKPPHEVALRILQILNRNSEHVYQDVVPQVFRMLQWWLLGPTHIFATDKHSLYTHTQAACSFWKKHRWSGCAKSLLFQERLPKAPMLASPAEYHSMS